MEPKFFRLPVTVGGISLLAAKGHFATKHSHINYFIDVTAQKYSLHGATSVARQLAGKISGSMPVDTILCMDGTSVIGTCLAKQLTKSGYGSSTADELSNLFILKGEPDNHGRLIFRENARYMLEGKNVLVMMCSLTTGTTAQQGKRSVEYYGGHTVGVAAIYSNLTEVAGLPVISVFDCNSLKDYSSFTPSECPMCRMGLPIDAVVNTFGYSRV